MHGTNFQNWNFWAKDCMNLFILVDNAEPLFSIRVIPFFDSILYCIVELVYPQSINRTCHQIIGFCWSNKLKNSVSYLPFPCEQVSQTSFYMFRDHLFLFFCELSGHILCPSFLGKHRLLSLTWIVDISPNLPSVFWFCLWCSLMQTCIRFFKMTFGFYKGETVHDKETFHVRASRRHSLSVWFIKSNYGGFDLFFSLTIRVSNELYPILRHHSFLGFQVPQNLQLPVDSSSLGIRASLQCKPVFFIYLHSHSNQ